MSKTEELRKVLVSKKQKLYCPFCGTPVAELPVVIPDLRLKRKARDIYIDYCPCGYYNKPATTKNKIIGAGFNDIKEIFGKELMDWMWTEITFADLSKKVKFVYLYSAFSKRNEFRIFVDKRIMFNHYIHRLPNAPLTRPYIRSLIKRKSAIVEKLSDAIIAVKDSSIKFNKVTHGTFHLL